jgi:hypothetical protein
MAISALLNRIGQKKSTTLLASSQQQFSRSPADYLIDKIFDQQIGSPSCECCDRINFTADHYVRDKR